MPASKHDYPQAAHQLKAWLKSEALKEGFSVAGFTLPVPPIHHEHLVPWLDGGCQADMHWMNNHREKRLDPKKLFPPTKSIMVLGENYAPPGDALYYLKHPNALGISAYARHDDYHIILKKRLRAFFKKIAHAPYLKGEKLMGRFFVDTAPVLEKPLAQMAGLGWVGKNSMLTSRRFGGWLFLAECFLNIDLPPDEEETDHCGRCERCLKACPTKALTPYHLDSRRCLAYWTIEARGSIPEELRPLMGNRVFGCDDCVAVCPWNRFAPPGQNTQLQAHPMLIAPQLLSFVTLDEQTFRRIFRHSPLKRTGRARFMRNLAVALGNWAEPQAIDALKTLSQDHSALVREHALWGLKQAHTNAFRINDDMNHLFSMKKEQPS
ncbi:tRNA epoxyqueuosine(34) reductase QueG [Magnetococcales bacterium HHB-1]